MSELLENMSRNQIAKDYPDRLVVPDNHISWGTPLIDYTPAYFANERVLGRAPEGGDCEDPALITNLAPSVAGDITFDWDGRPLHPLGRTGIYGKGHFYYYGPNVCGDLLSTRGSGDDMEAITGIRVDNGKRAITGGHADRKRLANGLWQFEDPLMAAIREHEEEAGIDLMPFFDQLTFQLAFRGIVRQSARCTDNAWLETYMYGVDVSHTSVADMEPVGGDDIVEGSAEWSKISELDLDALHDDHGFYIREYVELRQS